jgi:hypothetical protein
MGLFLGFVEQEGTIDLPVLVTNAGTPVNTDALPGYRIYGPGGLLAAGGMSLKDSGTVSNATNASPIVVTSAGHGLTTGTVVTVAGVVGNLAANTTRTVTVIDANSFSLDGTTGSGAYTLGGTWNTAGLYHLVLSATGSNGFQAGTTYTLLVTAEIAGVGWADLSTFTVT